jgi:hypothetical protein
VIARQFASATDRFTVICGDHTERTKADARPDRASEPAGNPFHQSTDDGRKRINVINDYDGKISLSFGQLRGLATADSPTTLR